jgi:hypothetical protein
MPEAARETLAVKTDTLDGYPIRIQFYRLYKTRLDLAKLWRLS